MKRTLIGEERSAGGGSHPDAGKPLSAFRRITAVCNDCGHVAVLEEDQLGALSAVPTFGDLWKHAFCQPCRDADTKGPSNIAMHGVLAEAPLRPAVEWSTAPVFGEARDDPFPTLPRRSIFDRR